MASFLNLLENPQIKYEKYFEVLRDFRKGGLNPDNYEEFMQTVNSLPVIRHRTPQTYLAFEKFKLTDIDEDDFVVIQREIIKRAINDCKMCWHPDASSLKCDTNSSGKINVSAAHSIQNNGILSQIAEDGHVMTYATSFTNFKGDKLGKKLASIFWGFCNRHDSIFKPIEIEPYSKTEEQHFLFAYRGFVVAAHKKVEVSEWMNFGEQSKNDILQAKRIFNEAIQKQDYSVIKTHVVELDSFYPFAVSSSFYLDFDFGGKAIPHSENRMETVFVTFLPQLNKSFFLLSYFTVDEHLYGALGKQLENRNNLRSDITMLLSSHVENIYFNPTYYKAFIEEYEHKFEAIFMESQMDHAVIDEKDNIHVKQSFTPNNYLSNKHQINFFGY